MSAHSSKLSEQVPAAARAAAAPRPTRRRRPTARCRRPQTVEDQDACALYAAVRKDGKADPRLIEKGFVALQKMLHRAGNVDGEGDGCGVMIDIPRVIWQEEVRRAATRRSLALDPPSPSRTCSSRARRTSSSVKHARPPDPAPQRLARARRARGPGDSSALGPTAREEEPHFWQIGGLVPDAEGRDRILFDVAIEIERRSTRTSLRFSAESCVYKVMGAPHVLQGYFDDLSDPRSETVALLGHNRYSTNTWPSFMRVQPFSVLGHNGEINTIARLRAEARMLGVPIRDDSSDSQDLNRLIETLIHRRGLSLPEAMELAVPPIVNEIRQFPEELRGFYMYLRQAMGPFAQGPIALIARNGDEYVFSVDALGLRPLWEIHADDAYVFSSEPGVVPLADMSGEPKPLVAGREGDGPREARQGRAAVRPPGDAEARAQALARARGRRRRRRLRAGHPDRRPAGGTGDPGLRCRRPVRAGESRGAGARRYGLAARGHQARPADGLERRRADRLAGV